MVKKDKRIKVVAGEALEQDVLSMDGSIVLCAKGTIITRELIDRLSNWIVEEEPRRPREKRKKKAVRKNIRNDIVKRLEFEEIVSQKTREELEKSTTDLFKGINVGAKTDISSIENAISTLVDEVPDNQDVPLKLSELKRHSSYVFEHSVECSIIATFIATSLNYPQHDVNSFALSMLMHDVGALQLPDKLFDKAAMLTEEDWKQVKKHPELGWELLKTVPGMDPLALMIAIGHHKNADGSGYPESIDFDTLPTLVHISVIIDDFSALTSVRSYRSAYHMNEAIEIILSQREKYHPGALENFISVVGIFPITTFLRLNTGEVGVVVRNNPENLFLPELKLALDPAGKPYEKEIIVNLLNEPVRKVVAVVDNI